ncbi:MAG: single-stranded DNA-binding protein [Patescibacteria group bacterium]|nr:single-stranded DNA-binding protein [Patescibacteria group bacterium]
MSSRSLNKVELIGNLTRDPELRYTPKGTPVCTFGLATNRSWQPSSGGDRQEETEFHRIVAWNKLAELCNQLLFKGRKAYVEGRLQTRNWTDASGQERTTVEVIIDNMIVLDSKHKNRAIKSDVSYQAESVTKVEKKPAAKVEKKPVKKVEKKPAAKVKSKKSTKPVTKKVDDGKINPDDIPF